MCDACRVKSLVESKVTGVSSMPSEGYYISSFPCLVLTRNFTAEPSKTSSFRTVTQVVADSEQRDIDISDLNIQRTVFQDTQYHNGPFSLLYIYFRFLACLFAHYHLKWICCSLKIDACSTKNLK